MSKVVSVVGATGAQGGSIVDVLLKDNSYKVRALTRNPDSDSAKALAAKGAEVVKGDAGDIASLTAAFEGSYAIFAVTDFWTHFFSVGAEKAMEIEIEQGLNLAKAAAATKSLKHYVWSTLPGTSKVSGGKFFVPHFDGKVKVDNFIKADASLVAKTTFLWVGFYATNFVFPVYTPYYIPTADTYVQIQSAPADTMLMTIGDARANVGPFVKAILEKPEETANGRFVLAYVEQTTFGGLLQAWARAQGKKAEYLQIDRDVYHRMWPGLAEELGVMSEYWTWAGEKSWTAGEENVLTAKDLGVTGLVGVKETLAALKL